MKNRKAKNKKKKDEFEGIFVPAFMFIGLGIGFFVGQIVGGVLLGLGVGFLVMALFKMKSRK